MSHLMTLLALMFAFTLSATAATPAFDFHIEESCTVAAEDKEAEEEAEEEEPDCE